VFDEFVARPILPGRSDRGSRPVRRQLIKAIAKRGSRRAPGGGPAERPKGRKRDGANSVFVSRRKGASKMVLKNTRYPNRRAVGVRIHHTAPRWHRRIRLAGGGIGMGWAAKSANKLDRIESSRQLGATAWHHFGEAEGGRGVVKTPQATSRSPSRSGPAAWHAWRSSRIVVRGGRAMISRWGQFSCDEVRVF